MFSTLRGVRPAYANFQIKNRIVLINCSGLSIRSVNKAPKLAVERFKFKIQRYDIPSKSKIQNRGFHTSERRCIPPILLLIFQPIVRFGSVILGRTFRKWWMRKEPSERERYAAWFRKKKPYFLRTLGAIFTLFLIFYLTHIEVTPITNRPRFIMYSEKQQAAFAKLAFEEYLKEYKDHILPSTHPIYTKLFAIRNRLINANKDLEYMKDTEWTLTVIDDPSRNAFVLPGGNIFIFTGILPIFENDDQLSFIIAHEMAHALLKHSVEKFSNGFILEILFAIPIIILWAFFPDLIAVISHITGLTLVNILHDLPYSRALENEADEVGLILAAKACVDVREAVVFWALMRSLTELGEEPPDIAWLSTHPDHEEREKNLNELLSKAIELRSDCQCPRLDSIIDPRKKFQERSIKEIGGQFKQRGII